MKIPVNKSWFVRYLRLMAGKSTDNRRVVLEDCAELLEGLICDLEAFESVVSSPGAVEDMAIEINRLTERLAQVERERDAAVADLSNSCAYCKHTSGTVDEPPCTECFHPKNNIIFAPITRTKFEWRGVCPENTKEE